MSPVTQMADVAVKRASMTRVPPAWAEDQGRQSSRVPAAMAAANDSTIICGADSSSRRGLIFGDAAIINCSRAVRVSAREGRGTPSDAPRGAITPIMTCDQGKIKAGACARQPPATRAAPATISNT